MISGALDVSLTPQTNTIYILRHQDTSSISREEARIVSENISFVNFIVYGTILVLGNRRSPKDHEDAFLFENLEYRINIFLGT